MAKKRKATAVIDPADVPVVGPREPCPCGSGKKYKVCHGREAAVAARRLVPRPFEGLPGECDWVALREMVPAATAVLTLTGTWAEAVGERPVTVASVLPLAWPGLVRADGSILLGLQVRTGSGDASRDVADVLERAIAQPEGGQIGVPGLPGPGPRLQDMIDLSRPFDVTVHEGFDYWLDGATERSPEVQASLSDANSRLVPTRRLRSVDAAYWARMGPKEFLRWVMPHEEESLLTALARMHVAGTDTLGAGTRLIGTFRAHGLLVPVWDLIPGTEVDEVEEPAQEFGERLLETLTDTTPVTPEIRAARAGLQNRQLTLR